MNPAPGNLLRLLLRNQYDVGIRLAPRDRQLLVRPVIGIAVDDPTPGSLSPASPVRPSSGCLTKFDTPFSVIGIVNCLPVVGILHEAGNQADWASIVLIGAPPFAGMTLITGTRLHSVAFDGKHGDLAGRPAKSQRTRRIPPTIAWAGHLLTACASAVACHSPALCR